MKRKDLIISSVIGLLLGAVVLFVFAPGWFVRRIPQVSAQLAGRSGLREFTAAELAKYDGSDPDNPIYLALDGQVYDITAGKDYYKTGGVYNFLAGRDASVELHLAGGDIIRRKYPVIGILTD